MTTSSSRRAFLKSGAGAVIAGGALLRTDLVEAGTAPQSPDSSAATGTFRPAETNVPQAQYPRVDAAPKKRR